MANLRRVDLDFNYPFPSVEIARESLTALVHTIIFHRSTGVFTFKNNSSSKFEIGSIGVIDDKLSSIRLFSKTGQNNTLFPYVRINSQELYSYVENELYEKVKSHSSSFFVKFYTRKPKTPSIFGNKAVEKTIWEMLLLSKLKNELI